MSTADFDGSIDAFTDLVNKRSSGLAISGEAHTVPGSGTFTYPLIEVPDSTIDVTLSGASTAWTEVTYVPTASGEFQVNYTTGVITHHSSDAGKDITASYTGLGSCVLAEQINDRAYANEITQRRLGVNVRGKFVNVADRLYKTVGRIEAYAHTVGDSGFEIASGKFSTWWNAQYDFPGYSANLGIGGNCEVPAMTAGNYRRVLFVVDERNWIKTYFGTASESGNPPQVNVRDAYAAEIPVCSVLVQDDGRGIAGSIKPLYDNDLTDLRPLIGSHPAISRWVSAASAFPTVPQPIAGQELFHTGTRKRFTYGGADSAWLELTSYGDSPNLAGSPFVTMYSESSLHNEYVLGTSVIMQGTRALQPPAATAGRLYNVTNEYVLERDYGNEWHKIATYDATKLVTSAFALSRLYFGGVGGKLSQSANLHWDIANSRLGIGTTSPDGSLHVSISDVANSELLTVENLAAGSAWARIRHLGTAGDAVLMLQTDGVTWYLAADNSDSDSFVFGQDSSPTSGVALRVDTSRNFAFTQKVSTSGPPTFQTFTAAAHTTLTASTEAVDVNFNLARTVQFAEGALATQRAFLIQAPTYAFDNASTITTAVTCEIAVPVVGTNATLTSHHALRLTANDALTSPQLAITQSSTGDAGLRLVLGTSRSYSIAIDNSASDSLVISTAASAVAVAGTGDLVTILATGAVGIGTVGPDAKLDVLATTEQLRMTYTDGSVYVSQTCNSSGNWLITPTGATTLLTCNEFRLNSATGVPQINLQNAATTELRIEVASSVGFISTLTDNALVLRSNSVERIRMNSTEVVINDTQIDVDFRVESNDSANMLLVDAGNNRVGINVAPLALLHADQASTTGAIPVLTLDQADVSEEFIRFIGTSANAVLTQSLVEAADVTTATIAGYLEINVQDAGAQIAAGAYYVPFYTLA